MLDLNLIRIDGGTQSREKLNEDTVAEYAEAYKAGVKFPPVIVFFDGTDHWLADGFHRYFGAKAAGVKQILENITPGTVRDAVRYSLGANKAHGLPPNNADKRKSVLMMLADAEWVTFSDNAIAKEVGVSVPFVGKMRSSLLTVNSDKEKTERTYTTKQGTQATMKTGGIGKRPPVESDSTERLNQFIAAPSAAFKPVQIDEGAPDQAEFDSFAAAEKAEENAMRFLLASDAPMADMTEKYKQQIIMIERLNSRITGLQNQSMAQIKTIKSLKSKLAKLEQAA